MKQGSISLVIADQKMPEMSGTEFLQKVKESYPDTIRIILTGYADIKASVEAINKGEVYKYISKPWSTMDIRHTVQQALNQYNLRKKNRILNEEILEQNRNLILLKKDLEGKVMVDGMTGLYNHRHFQKILGKEIKAAERYGHLLSLVMADIDDFKQINDDYGHQMGDKVLKFVADILKEESRQDIDSACRYGGEEFAIILPQINIKNAISAAERLRLKIADRFFEAQQTKFQVTMSFGIAEFKHEMLKEDFIENADKNLYYAKKQGHRVRKRCFRF